MTPLSSNGTAKAGANDRLSAGWIRSVLRDRGLPCPDHPAAQRLVAELNSLQRAQVVSALQQLSRGTDDSDSMAFMSLVARSAASATAAGLAAAGVTLTAGQVLQLLRDQPTAESTLVLATKGGTEAIEAQRQLRDWAEAFDGGAGHDAAPPAAPPANGSSGHKLPAPAAGRTSLDDQSGAHAAMRDQPRVKARVYSGAAALVFEVDTLKAEPDEHPVHTVTIEAATGKAAQAYHWDKKVVFQLTARELPQVVACLMGWTKMLEFRGHGPHRDKTLRLEHQGRNVFVRITQGARNIPCPIDYADVYAVVMVCLRALTRNAPEISTPAILDIIRSLAVAAPPSS